MVYSFVLVKDIFIFIYVFIIFIVLFGFILFGELFDMFVIVGYIVIIGVSYYMFDKVRCEIIIN